MTEERTSPTEEPREMTDKDAADLSEEILAKIFGPTIAAEARRRAESEKQRPRMQATAADRSANIAGRALAGWPALVVGLGLGEPIRAALRAAAREFAATLGGDEETDAPTVLRTGYNNIGDGVREMSDGKVITTVELGDEPYLLLRLTPAGEVAGIPAWRTRVTAGGDDGPGFGALAALLVQAVDDAESEADKAGVSLDDFLRTGGFYAVGYPSYSEKDAHFEGDGCQGDGLKADGSGNGPSTEDPHGNRSGDTPPKMPEPTPADGDDQYRSGGQGPTPAKGSDAADGEAAD